jgi:lambda repressor-like predicted transcriptional regulator
MDNFSVDIKAALRAAGSSQSDIARMLRVSPVAIHNVTTGKRRTPRIRKAIALAIGRPISDIWPETNQEENQ